MNKIAIIILCCFSTLISFSQQVEQRYYIHFNTAHSQLQPIARYQLDSIASILKEAGTYTLEIYGHTDLRGSASYNQQLSEMRERTIHKYLVARGISISKSGAFGKNKPIAENTTSDGRKLNRRVEIYIHYPDREWIKRKQKQQKDNLDLVINTHMEPAREKDTTIVGPQGTMIHFDDCAFSPYDRKDIHFEFKELYDQASVDAAQIVTLTSDKRCLRSAGMVFIKAYYKGREIQPKCPVDIAMPTEEIDTAMKLYDYDANKQEAPWKLSSSPLNNGKNTSWISSARKSKNYYTFSTASFGGGFNCDAITGFFPGGIIARKIGKRNYTFRIPKSAKNQLEIKSNDMLSRIPPKRVSARQFYIPPECVNDFNVTATYYRKGTKMTCTRNMYELKYKRIRNVYKFRKKWFQPAMA